MKLSVLICDDDPVFINKLKTDVNDYFKIRNQDIIIDEQTKDFLDLSFKKYNIIFMDIDLANERVDGILLASQFKIENPGVLIIFTSARNELVFKTFKVGGFQFIRKSHYLYDFNETMQQISDYLSKNLSYALLTVNGRKKKVYMNNIKYIISIGHEITINCYDSELIIRSTMKQTLEILDFNNLIQIQKNFAVNLDYINDFFKWKVICDEGEFAIGRKYQKNFQLSYENYLIHHNGRI